MGASPIGDAPMAGEARVLLTRQFYSGPLTGTLKVPYSAYEWRSESLTTSLVQSKKAFAATHALRITRTTVLCAESLGISLQDIVEIVQCITHRCFFKSITSVANAAIWQDVYHVPWDALMLYVKFTVDSEGYLVISLKEK